MRKNFLLEKIFNYNKHGRHFFFSNKRLVCICDKEENQRYPTQNKPRVVHILTVCCVQVTIFNYRFSSSFPSSQVTSSQLISQFVLERNASFTSCRNRIIHSFSSFLFCIPYISQGSVDKDSTSKAFPVYEDCMLNFFCISINLYVY